MTDAFDEELDDGHPLSPAENRAFRIMLKHYRRGRLAWRFLCWLGAFLAGCLVAWASLKDILRHG